MLEARDHLGLAGEPGGEGLVVHELGGEDLQGDMAIESGFVDPEDGRHPSLAELIDHPVRSETRALFQWHGVLREPQATPECCFVMKKS